MNGSRSAGMRHVVAGGLRQYAANALAEISRGEAGGLPPHLQRLAAPANQQPAPAAAAADEAAGVATTAPGADAQAFVLALVVCVVLHALLLLRHYQQRRMVQAGAPGKAAAAGASAATTTTTTTPASSAASPDEQQLQSYRRFTARYLAPFLMATGADWMMGPYIYALYEYYGYDMGLIGVLFVAGFGSSMVFGTALGSVADRYGRKHSCALYCVIMAFACFCKCFNSFPILVLGRLCGGAATSLLYSSFESWAVCAYSMTQLPSAWVGQMFSLATLGNALMAILAGLVANAVAEHYGFVAPFIAALAPLFLCFVLVSMLWRENYGEESGDLAASFRMALRHIRDDRRVALIGATSALFEGAMYIFVFMWTPTLDRIAGEGSVSYGLVFATFMVWKMSGTAIFRLLSSHLTLESFSRGMLVLAGLCLAVPIYASTYWTVLHCFCLFELCIGIYWPVICTLRAKYVREDVRATTISVFRLPLNLLVVVTLVRVGSMAESSVYALCAAALWLAALSQQLLHHDRLQRGLAATSGVHTAHGASTAAGYAKAHASPSPPPRMVCDGDVCRIEN